MWWRPDWDEYLQLAKKCVWALARIGTPEAIEALRDAATVGSDILREEAQYAQPPPVTAAPTAVAVSGGNG